MPGAVDLVEDAELVGRRLLASSDPADRRIADGLLALRREGSFEAAFGVAAGWHATFLVHSQARALCEIAKQWRGAPDREQGRQVKDLLKRYETTAWLTDRKTFRRPDGQLGYAFDYLSAGGPTSAERLRKLIARWVTDTGEVTHSQPYKAA
jgi:hypothetical protein